MGGPGPQRVGALYGHLEGAHKGERTVSISVAVTEKIAFEKKPLAPPSGETESGWGPMSRMRVGVGHSLNRLVDHMFLFDFNRI